MMKHPDSCNLRNAARLSAEVTGICVSPCPYFAGNNMDARCHPLVRLVRDAAVLWRLRALVHAVVPDHTGNTKPVVLEDLRAALGLGLAMPRHVAPRLHGCLIPKKRQRQHLALLGDALEPFHRDEAVDLF